MAMLPELVTLVGLVAAFAIFLGMALAEIRSAGKSALRSLKFQLAIATFIWLIGESLTAGYSFTYMVKSEFLEIHTVSMAAFALIVLARLPALVSRKR